MTHRCILVLFALAAPAFAGFEEAERLIQAAGKGDLKTVESLIDDGLDINAKSPFGVTALSTAADRGLLAMVKWLVAHGADVSAADLVYGYTPVDRATQHGHLDIVQVLIENGAQADDAIIQAVKKGHVGLLKAILKTIDPNSESTAPLLQTALAEAKVAGHENLVHLLEKAGAQPLAKPDHVLPPETQNLYAGEYISRYLGSRVTFRPFGDCMRGLFPNQPEYTFRAASDASLVAVEVPDITFIFHLRDGRCDYTTLKQGGQEIRYDPIDIPPRRSSYVDVADPATIEDKPQPVDNPLNWPQFRGPNASGIADGQHPPIHWNVETGHNIRWKTPIPGLGHASPVIWGDRIFILTAVNDTGREDFQVGPFEQTALASDSDKPHTWRLLCLDKSSGRILWDRVVHQGVPRTGRLRKWSHANATPATNGRYIAVVAGAEGLFCFDFDGKLLWKKDLGVLDAGWYYDPGYQWGFGSSPIIYKDTVILQCDRQKDSFIAAFDLKTGEQRWNSLRREYPSWSTPAVFEHDGKTQLVTNGSRAVRGYDPDTGKLVWIMEGESRIAIPTPVFGDEFIFVASGYKPLKPLYGIRPSAEGNITLPPRTNAGRYVVWRKARRGEFAATPVAYGGEIYLLRQRGAVVGVDQQTGRFLGAAQLGGCGHYSASPVAADGRLYCVSEAGEFFVTETVKDNEIKILALNFMDEPCLATPAVSDGTIFIRTVHHLYAVGHTKPPEKEAPDESG